MFHAKLSSRCGGGRGGLKPDAAFCQQEAIFHNMEGLEGQEITVLCVILQWMDAGKEAVRLYF